MCAKLLAGMEEPAVIFFQHIVDPQTGLTPLETKERELQQLPPPNPPNESGPQQLPPPDKPTTH
jgi:hypothetical protein